MFGLSKSNVVTAPSISLQKKIDASRISLEKKSLATHRMAVRAYIDASGSMGPFYSSGAVQELTERALGFAINIDDDGEIPIHGFGSYHVDYGTVTADNYQGYIARCGLRANGTTNLSASLEHLQKEAKRSKDPIYALIVTDGRPNSETEAIKHIKQLSNYAVFIKILVIGNDAQAWNFVSGLDNMARGRLIDNVDGQKINNPASLTDSEFADKMVEELDSWFVAAKAAGLVR